MVYLVQIGMLSGFEIWWEGEQVTKFRAIFLRFEIYHLNSRRMLRRSNGAECQEEATK